MLVRVSGTGHRHVSRCRSTWPNFTGRPQSAGGRPGAVHRHQLDEHRSAWRTGGAQPESGRRRGDTLFTTAAFRTNMAAAGDAAQLLRAQSRRQQRRQCAPTAASRSTTRCRSTCAAPCRDGLAVDANYVFAQALRVALDTLREARGARAIDRRRAARAEADGALRAAVRTRHAVRRRTPIRWLDGGDRRLVAEPDRPRAERDRPQLRQRPRRRHVDRRAARRVQDPHRSRHEDRLHAAAGHHRQHDQGVQHQRDVSHRLRRAGCPDRPLPGAGQRPRLHPESSRRLRAGRRVRDGPIFTRFDLQRAKRFQFSANAAASISRSTS